jgi:hypothetical protein
MRGGGQIMHRVQSLATGSRSSLACPSERSCAVDAWFGRGRGAHGGAPGIARHYRPAHRVEQPGHGLAHEREYRLRVGEQEPMQHRVRDHPQPYWPLGAGREGPPVLDEHPVFADHLPRPEVRDGRVAMRIEHSELAAGHDVCIARLLALLEQELAIGERARLHERRQETQVLPGEHAEYLAGA